MGTQKAGNFAIKVGTLTDPMRVSDRLSKLLPSKLSAVGRGTVGQAGIRVLGQTGATDISGSGLGLNEETPMEQTPSTNLAEQGGINKVFALLIAKDMQETGGQNITGLNAIAKILGVGTGKMTAQERKNATSANSGLRAIDTMEKIIASDPHVLLKAAIPGNIGARTFATARREAADIITRLRTGAALNEEEQKFYQNQMPTLLDDAETIKYKLNVLRQLFSEISNPQSIEPDTSSLFE